jgi:hypothetical protein
LLYSQNTGTFPLNHIHDDVTTFTMKTPYTTRLIRIHGNSS